jgi:hypothetical protein
MNQPSMYSTFPYAFLLCSLHVIMSSHSFVLKTYSASIFCRIRHHWGVSKEEWVNYLGPGKRKLSGGPSMGKSKYGHNFTHSFTFGYLSSVIIIMSWLYRSFFYFAEDNRFILKTTNHSEARFLRKILPGNSPLST